MEKILSGIGLKELDQAAEEILIFAGHQRIICFKGELGAGKTTLIKKLSEKLGVKDPVSSPTYALVNIYKSAEGSINHFDFYRIRNESEALDIGFEEYLDSGNFCLIEWPEMIPGILSKEKRIEITIKVNNASRDIELKKMTE